MNAKTDISIAAVYDYVVKISGVHNYEQYQLFQLESNPNFKLILIYASKDFAFCLTNGKFSEYHVGHKVVPDRRYSQIHTPKHCFGKVLNIYNDVVFDLHTNKEGNLGKKDKDKELAKNKDNYYKASSSIFPKANDLLDYLPLKEQLFTGYILIDLLIPIGKGQRQAILGDKKTGKSFLALNTIINQKDRNMKCIYVAIGQNNLQITSAIKMLKDNDALNHTMIIQAEANNPYEIYLAPYVAMAHAENICNEQDVLVVIDDLTAHANIYREIALLIDKPVGKEAFPGDMFYAHSKLLERAGNFYNKHSITCLPIIELVDNDIGYLIPLNNVSICDGQIVMNSSLKDLSILPAIDIDLSVSRIGSSIQKQFISNISRKVGKIYSAYRRQKKLAALKFDLNSDLDTLITNGTLIEQMFLQKGVTNYSEETIFLTAKLIEWDVLKNIPNTSVALEFLSIWIRENEVARNTFNSLFNDAEVDEKLVADYFIFSLTAFSNYRSLNWKLPPVRNFMSISNQELEEISKKMNA